jgi:hypothetical protein
MWMLIRQNSAKALVIALWTTQFILAALFLFAGAMKFVMPVALEELNVPPTLTRAAADVFRRSNESGFPAAFEQEPPHFQDVIDHLDRHL